MGNKANREPSGPAFDVEKLRSDLENIGLGDFMEQFEKMAGQKITPDRLCLKLTPYLTDPNEARLKLEPFLARCKKSVSVIGKISSEVTELVFSFVNINEVMFLQLVEVLEAHFLDSDRLDNVGVYFLLLRGLSWKFGRGEAHEIALTKSMRYLNTISSFHRVPHSKIQFAGFESMCDSLRLLPADTMLEDATLDILDQLLENYSEHNEFAIRNLSYVLKNAAQTRRCVDENENEGHFLENIPTDTVQDEEMKVEIDEMEIDPDSFDEP